MATLNWATRHPVSKGNRGLSPWPTAPLGFEADTITLIEAHGTGTSLGDPIEIESLSRVFRQTTDKRQYCAIGSLKTNIGHLDVAAGVTGLIKTSLALRNRVLPPSLNYEQPNPNIDFESSPFFVNTQLRDWEAPFPRRAGLSSFGVGGTNAHVVIEEAPAAGRDDSSDCTAVVIALGSLRCRARSPATGTGRALAGSSPYSMLADVAFTLQTGRKTFNYSLATVANDLTQAITVLRWKSRRNRCSSSGRCGAASRWCSCSQDRARNISIWRAIYTIMTRSFAACSINAANCCCHTWVSTCATRCFYQQRTRSKLPLNNSIKLRGPGGDIHRQLRAWRNACRPMVSCPVA